MLSSLQKQSPDHAQRVQVEMQATTAGKRVVMRLESYDEGLGWYSSGSLVLPLHQLPLLEQAISDMRRMEATSHETADIIPFPGSEA